MFDFDNIAMPYQMKDTLVNKIRLLENEEYITEDLARIMHRLRLGGNEARHEGTDSLQKAKLLLPQAYSLCEWFMQVYGDYTYQPKEYHLPAEQPEAAFVETAKDKAEEARLRKQDNEKAQQAVPVPHKERSQANLQAANKRPKTEAETRCLIDEQLRQVGWEADTTFYVTARAAVLRRDTIWRLPNGLRTRFPVTKKRATPITHFYWYGACGLYRGEKVGHGYFQRYQLPMQGLCARCEKMRCGIFAGTVAGF